MWKIRHFFYSSCMRDVVVIEYVYKDVEAVCEDVFITPYNHRKECCKWTQ